MGVARPYRFLSDEQIADYISKSEDRVKECDWEIAHAEVKIERARDLRAMHVKWGNEFRAEQEARKSEQV